jgi:hypothetical protein
VNDDCVLGKEVNEKLKRAVIMDSLLLIKMMISKSSLSRLGIIKSNVSGKSTVRFFSFFMLLLRWVYIVTFSKDLTIYHS